ncbi:MAG: hypothetical protein A2166_00415 [Omnitrophica WOR_2 bacterium RBG_13_41_10]|nr:MAG: hypothetical protein A2166_00415 [Omnitrophica WOR_2 bacterium RBG_13_41_10]
MKIAIVVGTFPTISETFILNQITSLIDLGYGVDIFAFSNSFGKKMHSDVTKYNLLNKINYFEKSQLRSERLIKLIKIIMMNFFLNFKEIIKFLLFHISDNKYDTITNFFVLFCFLRKKYDVIHFHFGHNGQRLIFLKEFLPQTKFITTFHGCDIRLGLERGGGIYKKLFQKSDCIIATSDFIKDKLTILGCPFNKIIRIYNGINLEKFNFRKFKKDNLVITTVARLEEVKNISLALKVIKSLKDEGKYKFKYYLIGDGSKREEVEQEILELNIKDVVVLFGTLTQEEVINKLKEADIFFLPSKAEGLPTVLLEAQAMKIPVVATNVGGVCEAIKDRVTGYLINENNIQQAKSRIIYLIENESLRKKMGEAGKRFIENNFNIGELTQKLGKVYNTDISN